LRLHLFQRGKPAFEADYCVGRVRALRKRSDLLGEVTDIDGYLCQGGFIVLRVRDQRLFDMRESRGDAIEGILLQGTCVKSRDCVLCLTDVARELLVFCAGVSLRGVSLA
jgi:hypothetical protein